MVESTGSLRDLYLRSRQRPVDPGSELVAEVSLAQLSIVIAANGVDHMEVWIVLILAHDDCMVVRTRNADDLHALPDVGEDHRRIAHVHLGPIA